MSLIYLIGSLRNPMIPLIGKRIRDLTTHEVFDDWHAAGEHADDAWRDYEKDRGHSYIEALDGEAAQHVFRFDYDHLLAADIAVLALPAGKSAHMELGWMLGRGKLGLILLDNPERWDVMYRFAHGVFDNLDNLVVRLRRHQ